MEAGCVNQKSYLEILKYVKSSDILRTRNVIASGKIFNQRKMNKKLKVTLEVLDNIAAKYADTKNYTGQNLAEVIYFVGCFSLLGFRWTDGLLFHALAILF